MNNPFRGDEEGIDESEKIPQDIQPPNIFDNVGMSDETPTELDKIFKQMFDPENLQHLTELNGGEITAFSTLGVLADKYDIAIIKAWIIQNMKLRVSKGRKGRIEVVKITSRGQYQEAPQNNNGFNWFRRNN